MKHNGPSITETIENATEHTLDIIKNATENTSNIIEKTMEGTSNIIKNASEHTLKLIKKASEQTSKATETAANSVYTPVNFWARDLVLKSTDLLSSILKYFDVKYLGVLAQVNTKFRIASDSIWSIKFQEEKVPTNWPGLSFKEKCISFLKECATINKTYPDVMIKALGAKNIAALPVLKDKQGSWGIWHYYHGFSGIGRRRSELGFPHYIGLAEKINDGQEPSLGTITLFEEDPNVILFSQDKGMLPNMYYSYHMNEKRIEYIQRLVNKDPCGRVTAETGIETEPRSNNDGVSIVELIDADEYKQLKKLK